MDRIHPRLGALVIRRHATLKRELARMGRPRSLEEADDWDRKSPQMYDELYTIERDSSRLWDEETRALGDPRWAALVVRVYDPMSGSLLGSTIETYAVLDRDRARAYSIAREHLCTMWRRPGATIEIRYKGYVVWRWAGWEGVL